MAHTKVTKTHSQNTGVANTFSYSGSFDVFKGTEVVALLDNVALTYTASTINESASPREYTVDTSASTIHIGGADLSSGTIIIRPVTDMGAPTPRATYAPGSSVTSEDLNNNQLQLMRKAMEYDEQKLSSIGGTMTGHLTMGEDQTIIFEGATDDGYETTLTVTDPTADRTITLPNVTGTVVTTGDTATVTATMMAADSVDSSELVDGSIDTSHISSGAVTTAKLAADVVTGAKIADDAINSEHYTDGSIDTAHIADANITTAKLADNAVTTAKITDANVTTAKLAADAVTTAKITDGNVTTAKIADDAVTGAKIATDAIGSGQLAAGAVDTAHINNLNVTTAKIAADAITGAKIADDAIDSEHYTDGSIDTAHIGGTQVTEAKIASNAVTTAKITDANVTTAKIADSNVTLAKLASDLKSTSISDSDTQIPTSGAVVDYVAAQIAPIGGLEVIANEDSFPSTQPASGVVISITDIEGLITNGSGVATNARTSGNGSDNVTINGFPSSLYSKTMAAGLGLMVSSTGSSQTYTYHKLLAKEADVEQLSNDINDFAARYRVNAGEPGSNNDAGDLVFDTNASKMKVYDGSSWGEVTSSGDFKYLVMTNAGTTNAATLNGSNVTFDLKETSTGGSAASVTSAAQLMVSVNGVVQKPNTGTSASGLDGFVLADSDTITFCAAPASGDDIFIIQTGSAITPTTPADGTVTAAKIGSGAVTTAKIADDAVTLAKMASGTDGQIITYDASGNPTAVGPGTDGQVLTSTGAGSPPAFEAIPAGVGGATGVDFNDNVKARFGTGNDLEIYHSGSHSFISDQGTGDLVLLSSQVQIVNPANSEAIAKFTENGSCELYHNNVKKLETVANGINIDGYVNIQSASDIFLEDNGIIKLGTATDFQIYHDGSNSYIDNHTGDLFIRGEDDNIILQAVDGENSIKCNPNGSVHLYYDNVDTFSTTSTGANLTFSSDNSTVAEGLFINNTAGNTGDNVSIAFSTDSGNRKKSAISHVDTGNYGRGDLVVSIDPDADSGSLDVQAHEKVRFQAAGGISFNGDSTQANALDDYEEGQFTPTVADGLNNPTFTHQRGGYIKIGRLVYFQIDISISGGTQQSNAFSLGGLPFTSGASVATYGYGGANLIYQGSTWDQDEPITMLVANGTTGLNFYKWNGASLAGNDSEWNDYTSNFIITGTYMTA